MPSIQETEHDVQLYIKRLTALAIRHDKMLRKYDDVADDETLSPYPAIVQGLRDKGYDGKGNHHFLAGIGFLFTSVVLLNYGKGRVLDADMKVVMEELKDSIERLYNPAQ